jgi:quercetin dioxygenase-like cupin family protein
MERWHHQDHRIGAYKGKNVSDSSAHDLIIRSTDVRAWLLETQPQLQPALFRLSAMISDYVMRTSPINELQLTQQEAIVIAIRSLIIFVIAVALPIGVWMTPAYAQDPAVVNSKTIRVRFENERVRVLEATLPPGAKEQVHSHPAYVIYVLAGGRYRNYAADGRITEGTFQTGDVIYRDPLTHAAENIGDKPMHFILVELKSEAGR